MDKKTQTSHSEALDSDVLEALAAAHEPVALPDELIARMRNNLMDNIRQGEKDNQSTFITVHTGEENDWIDVRPGARLKVLQGDLSQPDSLLSYLIRLEPGFTMGGHSHPFDEETLMLEGDLTLGDIKLFAGDFHFAAAGGSHGDVYTAQGCLAYMRGAVPSD